MTDIPVGPELDRAVGEKVMGLTLYQSPQTGKWWPNKGVQSRTGKWAMYLMPYSTSGQTAPEAICRAALRAVGVPEDAPAP
jgi:hypothetical protein